MLIGTGRLTPRSLAGRVAVVTGGGAGIGFEAARSLLWLGAKVAIAEIDARSCETAQARLCAEWPQDGFLVVPTDVSDEASVAAMAAAVERGLGPVDVVLNNATVAHVGQTVAEMPIAAWDRSYAVNLRAPALLARTFLPGMLARRSGVIAFVSSTGGPFMAAYETLKAAQVALGAALDAELDGSGVVAFTIGPGLVPTPTAVDAVRVLAPKMGMSLPEFYAMNRGALVSVEAAGAGFAAAIAMAERYAGQEISSPQALVDAGIAVPEEGALPEGVELPREVAAAPAVAPAESTPAVAPAESTPAPASAAPGSIDSGEPASLAGLARAVRATLDEQSAGWKRRSFFERQWMLRDFKQRAGMPVERWLELLVALDERLARGDVEAARRDRPPLEKLAGYYEHMAGLARGYVKDPKVREEQVAIVLGWKAEVDDFARALDAVQ